jgi:hypothetical protein
MSQQPAGTRHPDPVRGSRQLCPRPRRSATEHRSHAERLSLAPRSKVNPGVHFVRVASLGSPVHRESTSATPAPRLRTPAGPGRPTGDPRRGRRYTSRTRGSAPCGSQRWNVAACAARPAGGLNNRRVPSRVMQPSIAGPAPEHRQVSMFGLPAGRGTSRAGGSLSSTDD